jgi:FtsP/CotA-like multicopper oxidase with cupredoxin domain
VNKERRTFIQSIAAVSASAVAGAKAFATGRQAQTMPCMPGMRMPGCPATSNEKPEANPSSGQQLVRSGIARPVVSPDLADLAFEMDNGVKIFHLVAEPVKQTIISGRVVNLWGYNGSAPGPTIQVNQGDRVRIIVDNHLPEPTSMHWHGFEIPFDMDGAPGLSQQPISPGGRFIYEFTLHQEGTYFYHSHMSMQEMTGMIGGFIMHPQKAYQPSIDKDFLIILQEYAILPSNPTPNTMNMEFNWLTFNGKAGPAATPLIIRQGERVKIRLLNMGMDHHPIHLHGHQFVVTGTEAGRQQESMWGRQNTVLVGVAQARDIEFDAKYAGDWMIHCHLPHHMMNQMSSMAGPLTRRPGIVAGAGMEEGMGMIRGGTAISEGNGPSLGRGMGVGSTIEQLTSNGRMSQAQIGEHVSSMPGMQGMQMDASKADVSKDANSVPGFPQDAFMEGPVMAMDAMFQKPETEGLRPGWSGFIGGMMTLVRVLPPDQYNRIMELRAKQSGKSDGMPGMDMSK